jgi:hypothetical protein
MTAMLLTVLPPELSALSQQTLCLFTALTCLDIEPKDLSPEKAKKFIFLHEKAYAQEMRSSAHSFNYNDFYTRQMHHVMHQHLCQLMNHLDLTKITFFNILSLNLVRSGSMIRAKIKFEFMRGAETLFYIFVVEYSVRFELKIIYKNMLPQPKPVTDWHLEPTDNSNFCALTEVVLRICRIFASEGTVPTDRLHKIKETYTALRPATKDYKQLQQLCGKEAPTANDVQKLIQDLKLALRDRKGYLFINIPPSHLCLAA